MLRDKFKVYYKQVYIFLFTFLLPNMLFAQFYFSGQEPASQSWSQLNSPLCRLIYPKGQDSIAYRLLQEMYQAALVQQQAVGLVPKSLPLVLHMQSTSSNAQVAWAPKRMEFYHTPPQLSYSQEWYRQLALHEYRHVLQMSLVESALPKWYKALLGQGATAIQVGLFAPYWLLEGEAVLAETMYGHNGRGRDPFFRAQMKAQLLDKGIYSLEKATLGSYKDKVPDRYHLGYYLVGTAQQAYGPRFWTKTWYDIGRWRGFLPLASAIKHQSGMKKKQWYQHSLQNLQMQWQSDMPHSTTTSHFLTSDNAYIDYTYPAFVDSMHITALKEPYDDIASVILIDKHGKETKVFKPGYYISDAMSYANGVWTWVEYQLDPRWYYKRRNKIMLYDIHSDSKRCLKSNTQLFAPDLSADATKIVTVEVPSNSKYALVVLDTKTGKEQARYYVPNNPILNAPQWDVEGRFIFVEATNALGKSIWRIDTHTSTAKQFLLPKYSFRRLLKIDNNHHIIVGEDSKNAFDAYVYANNTDSVQALTNVQYALHSMDKQADSLVYAAYTSDGFRLFTTAGVASKAMPTSALPEANYPLAKTLSNTINHTGITNNTINSDSIMVQPYKKAAHLFRLHSWNPILATTSNTLAPGLHLQSQNTLSSMFMEGGIYYNRNTQHPNMYASIKYAGWYPVLQADVIYKRGEFSNAYTWNSTELKWTIALPWQFISGLWTHGVRLSAALNTKRLDFQKAYKGQSLQWWYNTYNINVASNIKTTWQNIYPDWGIALTLSYAHVWHGKHVARRIYGLSNVYLHGLFKHDGFKVSYAKQYTDGIDNFFNDVIILARGYTGIPIGSAESIGIDYQVPIAYPDRHLSSLVYLKRVVMGVFYDRSALEKMNLFDINAMQSYGLELTGDMHFLRSKFEVKTGVRISRLSNYEQYKNNPTAVSILFNINI